MPARPQLLRSLVGWKHWSPSKSLIHRYSDVRQQVAYYDRLAAMFDFFAGWHVLRFDEVAADEFLRLRSLRIRIATTDLKIAEIALTQDATLLSRKPRLRVESWLPGRRTDDLPGVPTLPQRKAIHL
jgi:hypothetical protein